MRAIFTKGLLAASVSALLLLGTAPGQPPWEDGMSVAGQAFAAGGRGGGRGPGGGSSGSHGGSGGTSHSDGGHDDHDHDGGHDDHDHDDGHEDGHDSSDGKKGKGPRYRGGRDASSKGKGGPGREVVEKIFESG